LDFGSRFVVELFNRGKRRYTIVIFPHEPLASFLIKLWLIVRGWFAAQTIPHGCPLDCIRAHELGTHCPCAKILLSLPHLCEISPFWRLGQATALVACGAMGDGGEFVDFEVGQGFICLRIGGTRTCHLPRSKRLTGTP